MLITDVLKKNCLRHCPPARTAILFTGGLDSTVLALLCRRQNPLLVFGAVEAPECSNYNNASITLSKKIATQLQLNFQVVPITRKNYLTHLALCLQLVERPPFDTDLPAASLLLQTLHQADISSVLSGMGSDELFSLPEKRLLSFITHQGKLAVSAHKKLAHHWGIQFNCPYLSSEVIQCAQQTPPQRKKNKQPLLLILKEHPAIYSLLQNRPPSHSCIPECFWLPALALIRTKNASGSESASRG